MNLEQYLKAIKDAISSAYARYEAARMKQDEAIETLKGRVDSLSKDGYAEEHNAITEAYSQEVEAILDNVRTVEDEQGGQYMNEVRDYYGANGEQIDLNEMNLIKSGLLLPLDEIWTRFEKYADNMTMLQIFAKYIQENKINLDGETGRKISHAINKLNEHGKAEEQALKTFINLSCAGLNHIGLDNMYIWVWNKLDEYEAQAQVEILEAKPIQTDEVKEQIDALEEQIKELEQVRLNGDESGDEAAEA